MYVSEMVVVAHGSAVSGCCCGTIRRGLDHVYEVKYIRYDLLHLGGTGDVFRSSFHFSFPLVCAQSLAASGAGVFLGAGGVFLDGEKGRGRVV
jgi:hypothetical protein